MALMSTCLGRLGSRYSLILDPVRKQIQYGSLGLMCQADGELILGLDDGKGVFCALPFGKSGAPFHMVDQRQTMTSVSYDAWSVEQGVSLRVDMVAPFWPRDERTSLCPAYVVKVRVERLDKVRWTAATKTATRRGVLRFGLKVPGTRVTAKGDTLELGYAVSVPQRAATGEGGAEQVYDMSEGRVESQGQATDVIFPLSGEWRVVGDCIEAPYDVSAEDASQEFVLGLASHMPAALFERFGRPMQLKYTRFWPNVAAVAAHVRTHWRAMCRKSAQFDALWLDSGLGASAQDLTALAFQSYLMCSLWCAGKTTKDWFSVWEGSCWFNSTVDVTYNEAMLPLSCWPELLEMVIDEWSAHANDAEADRKRRSIMPGDAQNGAHPEDLDYPGAILQHDMGAGWTANGMSYHHQMPVEENSNFLLLLYLYGRWCGKTKLFQEYKTLCGQLAEYLFWTDSTGNGFPDRGTANTIDDATPAVQYGRDNVYLGIKRLAALHAAGRMFEYVGDQALARRCRGEVRKAVKTLNSGWLGDHWGVCLDKSARGLVDCWSGKPLPYKELPGWDAFSLYTTNGLLPLMMIDDLPSGLSKQRLRLDVLNATRASITLYGCGHSSLDKKNMWVAMNVWRDCAAAYLGENLSLNCERYWNQQLFANGIGSEKANCFTETSLTNNLVWYGRGAATFGLLLAMPGLMVDGSSETASVAPVAPGRWPLLPLADWKTGRIPVLSVESLGGGKLKAHVEGAAANVKVRLP